MSKYHVSLVRDKALEDAALDYEARPRCMLYGSEIAGEIRAMKGDSCTH